MVQVTFYFGTTGVQKVVWDTKRKNYEIKNPQKLAREWQSDLGASDFKIENYNS